MANLNLSNFIIDRILSGVGYATDGSIYFKMDQCQDTSITCGSEATEIVDNVGAPVMTLYRAKTCEISGQNAILDMNLTAFQMGTTKKVAEAVTEVIEYVSEVDDQAEILFCPMDHETFIMLRELGADAIIYDAQGNIVNTVSVTDMSYGQPNMEYGDEILWYELSGDELVGDIRDAKFVITVEAVSDSKSTKIIAPAVEVITVPETHSLQLSHTPIATPRYIYTLNNDGSLGDSYEVGLGTSSDSTFIIYGKELELPYALNVGDQVFISYEYETTAGIEIVNSAKNFPKSCKLVLKALGYNPCEKDNKLACYIIFPSFEMSPDFDLSLQAGETQAWSGKASQDYCSKDKRLMSIVVVDEDDEMF